MPSRKGSPNKNKAFLLTRLQDMYGEDFHPIMKMAKAAFDMQKHVDETPESQRSLYEYKALIESWDKIAQYTEPKLKAIEQTGTVTVEHVGELTDEQLNTGIAASRARIARLTSGVREAEESAPTLN